MVRQLSFTCSIMMTFVTLIFSSQKPSYKEYLITYNKLMILKHETAAIALNELKKEKPISSTKVKSSSIAKQLDMEKYKRKTSRQLILKLYSASSKSLLSVDPDDSDKIYLLNPLHEAVRLGFTYCAKFLLDQGAHADAYNHVGKTPLHTACTIDDEKKAMIMAQMLIQAGCEPNKPTRLGDTPLYYAVLYKKWELARALIEQGAYDNPGPLLSVIPHMSTMPDSIELIEKLRLNKEKHNAVQPRMLVQALPDDNDLYRVLSKGDYKRAQLFLERGSGDNYGPSGSVLPFVINMHDQELAKSFLISLIAHNADPNFLIQGNNLLYHAVAQQKYVIAKSLLTMGAVDNTGPGGSVELGIAISNDSDLITLFKIRKDLPAPQFFERTQDLSPRY